MAQLRDALGGFDAVCNIAGWDAPGKFWEQAYEMWQRLMSINLWSTLHVCRATVPDLVAQESGTIVNVASDAGRASARRERPSTPPPRAASWRSRSPPRASWRRTR